MQEGEAERLFREALEIDRRQLGEDGTPSLRRTTSTSAGSLSSTTDPKLPSRCWQRRSRFMNAPSDPVTGTPPPPGSFMATVWECWAVSRREKKSYWPVSKVLEQAFGSEHTRTISGPSAVGRALRILGPSRASGCAERLFCRSSAGGDRISKVPRQLLPTSGNRFRRNRSSNARCWIQEEVRSDPTIPTLPRMEAYADLPVPPGRKSEAEAARLSSSAIRDGTS